MEPFFIYLFIENAQQDITFEISLLTFSPKIKKPNQKVQAFQDSRITKYNMMFTLILLKNHQTVKV